MTRKEKGLADLAAGMSKKDVAEKHGVSLSAVYEWVRSPKKRKPKYIQVDGATSASSGHDFVTLVIDAYKRGVRDGSSNSRGV